MSSTVNPSAVLLIPRLRIQNANAISSPLTHGFPSITAFLGLMWALERKLGKDWGACFNSVGVVCHAHQELASDDYVKKFSLKKPSLRSKDEVSKLEREGTPPSFVEEGRIHLTVSLLFGVEGDIVDAEKSHRAAFADAVTAQLTQMRIAGGTVLDAAQADPRLKPSLLNVQRDDEEAARNFRSIRRRLLPGFCLVSRDDLLADRLEALQQSTPSAGLLDAWLELSRMNWFPPAEASAVDGGTSSTVGEWTHDRKRGWTVPIPVGYGALSPAFSPGQVKSARDQHTPFQFVESLYSLGQWISPHRLRDWRQLLWYSHNNPDAGLYRACNDYAHFI